MPSRIVSKISLTRGRVISFRCLDDLWNAASETARGSVCNNKILDGLIQENPARDGMCFCEGGDHRTHDLVVVKYGSVTVAALHRLPGKRINLRLVVLVNLESF